MKETMTTLRSPMFMRMLIDAHAGDSGRFDNYAQAKHRLTLCAGSKILKGAKFRIIQRTDRVITDADVKQAAVIAAIDNES